MSRKGFTHVFMFLILVGYTALGALLFMAFEAPHENVEKLAIHHERMKLIDNLWNYTGTDYEQYIKVSKLALCDEDNNLIVLKKICLKI